MDLVIPRVRLYAAPPEPPAQPSAKSAVLGLLAVGALFGFAFWLQTENERSLDRARRTSKGPMTPDEFREWLKT